MPVLLALLLSHPQCRPHLRLVPSHMRSQTSRALSSARLNSCMLCPPTSRHCPPVYPLCEKGTFSSKLQWSWVAWEITAFTSHYVALTQAPPPTSLMNLFGSVLLICLKPRVCNSSFYFLGKLRCLICSKQVSISNPAKTCVGFKNITGDAACTGKARRPVRWHPNT